MIRERKFYKDIEYKLTDADEGIWECYASTFNDAPDSYGDVVDKGAFSKTIKEMADRIKNLWNHSAMEPIGRPLVIKEDSTGLFSQNKLSLGVQRAREVRELMSDGVINEVSIGYDTITSKMDGVIRHLKEVRLWDISPVTFAANPNATVLSVKSIYDELAELLNVPILGKSGRVLSAVNKDKVQAALSALQALLDSAGDEEPDKSTPETTEGKEAAKEIIEIIDAPELDAILSRIDAKQAERRIDAVLATIRR